MHHPFSAEQFRGHCFSTLDKVLIKKRQKISSTQNDTKIYKSGISQVVVSLPNSFWKMNDIGKKYEHNFEDQKFVF